jgi:hypothetical protein
LTDWQKVRKCYETEALTCQEVGKRFGIAPNTVARHVQKEGWQRGGGTIINLTAATDRLSRTVLAALGDEKQFYRYVLTEKNGGDSLTEEHIFQKMDIKAVQAMTSILRELSEINNALRSNGEMPEDTTFRVVLEGETDEWSK